MPPPEVAPPPRYKSAPLLRGNMGEKVDNILKRCQYVNGMVLQCNKRNDARWNPRL